jgi:type I restriction enzyme S subunit
LQWSRNSPCLSTGWPAGAFATESPPVAIKGADRHEQHWDVESLKTTHRAALAELDALFASLQHRAFTGTL